MKPAVHLDPRGLLQEQKDVRLCWNNASVLPESSSWALYYSCASVSLNTLRRSISMKIKEYSDLEFSICSFLSLQGQSSLLRDANANSVCCSRANVSQLNDKGGGSQENNATLIPKHRLPRGGPHLNCCSPISLPTLP